MSDLINILLIVGIIALGIYLIYFFIFKVKHLKTPDVFAVDGGVKTGKSLVCVYLAVRQYKKNRRKVIVFNFLRKFIGNPFRKLFKKPIQDLVELPMLYSNMPLNCVKYNDLTLSIILREVRIPKKSVCLIDEASLLADSLSGMYVRGMDKDRFDYVNEKLTLFLKLYGHYTHGGSCFYNSQQIIDLHFSFKRCTATYLYVVKNLKFPFFCLINCREVIHSEDNDVINVYNRDADDDSKPLFILKKYFKYYDRYYLSCLTDKLSVLVDYDKPITPKGHSCKPKKILTLSNFKSIKEYNERGLLNEKK